MEAIKEELQKTSAECLRLYKLERQRQARQQVRVEIAWTVGTIAFCHEPAAGIEIVEALQRKYTTILPEDVQECLENIQRRYLDCSVMQLAAWLQWETIKSKIMENTVKNILEEARLHIWICKQNQDQGVAPPPQFVWERRCTLLQELHGDDVDVGSNGQSPKSATAKKWIQRYRLRWNLALGKQPAKDLLPVSKMRDKVFENTCFRKLHLVDPFVAPIWGLENSPKTRTT